MRYLIKDIIVLIVGPSRRHYKIITLYDALTGKEHMEYHLDTTRKIRTAEYILL